MDPHKNPDSATIQNMFNRLARRYDLFNELTSLGMARGWRKETLRPVREAMRVLDLGCGTGDLAIGAAKGVGPSGEVVGLDFSPEMLSFARKRVEKWRLNGRVRFVEAKAEDLPLENRPFDLVVSGFVLRNLYKNIDGILRGVFQSLRPGGRISFLDITEPARPLLLFLWRAYMNSVVVFYGKILFGKDYPAFYLTESAERFLKAKEFVKKLEETGFREVRVRSFMLGTISLYQAVRP